MDELLLPIADETNKAVRAVLAQSDGPAYLRRARRVEGALAQLHEQCRRQRTELLTMVRLRLGMLQALAGDLSALAPWLVDIDQASHLKDLHDELYPVLRVPLQPTTSRRRLRAALADLTESAELFNRRWSLFLRTLDLTAIDELIHGYNRWYVLEKECVVRSQRIARLGFEPLPLISVESLRERFPCLPVPHSS